MFLFSLHTHRKRPLQNAAAVSFIAGISHFLRRFPVCGWLCRFHIGIQAVIGRLSLPVFPYLSEYLSPGITVPSEKRACRGLCFSPYRSSPGPAAGGIFPLFSQAGNVHKFSPVSGSLSRSTRPGSSRTAISQVALIQALFKWPPKTRPRTSPALMCRWA